MKKALITFAILPSQLLYLIVVLPLAVFGHNFRRYGRLFFFDLRPGTWVARRYRGWAATTFGRVVMFAPEGATPLVVEHERVHVRQFEADCFGGLVSGVVYLTLGSIFCALGGRLGYLWAWVYGLGVLWALTHFFALGASYLVAYLEGKNAYRNSHREEAAYDAEEILVFYGAADESRGTDKR